MSLASSMHRFGTVALVINGGPDPVLLDQLSDDHEIALLEKAVTQGRLTALDDVYQARAQQKEEEERFGDYVEDLITQPFVRPEIRDHGIQWLKSKIRIEQFQSSEQEASRVIADFAFKLYCENRELTDFLLAGPHAQVRVRVFLIKSQKIRVPSAA
jgi:hypothetical protein